MSLVSRLPAILALAALTTCCRSAPVTATVRQPASPPSRTEEPRPTEPIGLDGCPEPFGRGPTWVTGNLRAPSIVERIPPSVPPELATTAGVSILQLVVTCRGRIEDVQVLRTPDPRLGEAAAAAVRRWTITPAQRNDQPITASFTVVVHHPGD